LLCLTVLCPPPASGQTDVALTDLWDAPIGLETICRGRDGLFFICDLDLTTCREGAIYFESRSNTVRQAGLKPGFIFVGSATGIRDAVLGMNLKIPVYIDAQGTVFGSILEDRILPAVVRTDTTGTVVDVLYGGGESLDENITALLVEQEADQEPEQEGKGRRWWLILIPVAAVLAVLPFVLE
jgi:hypothetical protein